MFQRTHPYILSLEPGEHRVCGCGLTAAPPLCDGTRGSRCQTAIPIRLDAPRTVAICACGRTRTPPFCDGRHGYVEEKKRRRP